MVSTLNEVGYRLESVRSPTPQTSHTFDGLEYFEDMSYGKGQSTCRETSQNRQSSDAAACDDTSASDEPVFDNIVPSEGAHSQVPESSPCSPLTSITHIPPQTDGPAKLLAAAFRDLPWLLQFLANDSIKVVSQRKSKWRDNGIVNIMLPEGKSSNERKLFRGLAQRAMGVRLTQIQRQAQDVAKAKGRREEKTRVDELCEGIGLTDPRTIQKRTGWISKILHHFDFDPKDRETVLRNINAGVKQLVLEKIVGMRLQQSGRPNRPESVSAIAALNVLCFKNLRFEDIPRFVDLLFLPFSSVDLPLPPAARTPHNRVTKHFIPDIIVALSPRFLALQSEYDGSKWS
ncbi:hypothetical protein IFM61392_04504 [Aspergillus lentulus]|nr:hypothetical protein IFM61392_04504 [Aspergillus lentulus]